MPKASLLNHLPNSKKTNSKNKTLSHKILSNPSTAISLSSLQSTNKKSRLCYDGRYQTQDSFVNINTIEMTT